MHQKQGRTTALSSQFPQGLGVLVFVQIFSTLSFSVLYSSLVLYMKGTLGFSVDESTTITGFFLAFNYGLHLLGGFFSGRLVSNRLLFAISMILTIIACILLRIPFKTEFYLGLAFFLTGSGLNVTCLNCMVTQLFEPDDPRRENAFFWVYSAMNVGFFLGFSLSGYFNTLGDYRTLFMVGGVGNLLSLFAVFRQWHLLRDKGTILSKMSQRDKKIRQNIAIILVLFMIPGLYFMLYYAELANRLVLLSGLAMIVVLTLLAFRQQYSHQTKKMIAFVCLMVASLVFWSLYQTAPMGLVVFIENNVDMQLFGFKIAPQWIQNVNTIVIVLGGPLLSMLYNRLRKNGIDITIPDQFSAALLLIGLGFLVLPLGIGFANTIGQTHINWMIASYILQSVGELLLSPVGYAMIGRLAPAHLQGLMMGSWMMMTGVASTLSSYFSSAMSTNEKNIDLFVSNIQYSNVFTKLGLMAVVMAGILYLFSGSLNRLITSDKAEAVSEDENIHTTSELETA
jgi:POT family proton-dependent oligopeptide transporter